MYAVSECTKELCNSSVMTHFTVSELGAKGYLLYWNKQHWAYIIPIRGEPKSIGYEIQSAANCFSISLVPVEVLWVRFELIPLYRTTQETILEPAKRECSPFHLISPNNIKILWTTHSCLGIQSELRSVRCRSRRRDCQVDFIAYNNTIQPTPRGKELPSINSFSPLGNNSSQRTKWKFHPNTTNP